jgi:hypothetical protein
MKIERLYEQVEKEIGKICEFSREEFDGTLTFLESVRFVRRDPAKSASVIFVPD